MHLGWVEQEGGAYRGQMAIHVKPNGPPGAGYMAAIKLFGHLVVYPRMMRQMERGWQALRHDRSPTQVAMLAVSIGSGHEPRSSN